MPDAQPDVFSDGRSRLSQSETEALCFKAARGLGYSWGMAEEAAYAVGWLYSHGIDGTSALLSVLSGKDYVAPSPSTGNWSAEIGRLLCPIRTGAALSDLAQAKRGLSDIPTRIGPVGYPILIVPFLATCATKAGKAVKLDWFENTLFVEASGVKAHTTMLTLATTPQAKVAVSISKLECSGTSHSRSPALPDPQVIALLDELGMRTTVPASSASRDTGAGTGKSDND